MTATLTVIVGLMLGYAIWIYNRLIRDKNRVANGWSDIDVQLVRRHDLLPALVTSVKAYADYEAATLEAVTELRARSRVETNLTTKAGIEDTIDKAVGKLIVLAEDYPDLKADQNFRDLHTKLTEIEDHLQHARRYYNGAVRNLNTRIESFPDLLLARVFGFAQADFFEADPSERDRIAVDLAL